MATPSKKTLSLTQALASLLAKQLLPDLAERAEQPSIQRVLAAQHEKEAKKDLTADDFAAWRQRSLEQVGAAWILSCVFVRTLEDRGLLARARLAGEGAADSEQLFFELAPSLTARDYLLTVFREVASLPGAEDLLGPAHNPAWLLSPSNDGARALLDFFRQRDAQGALRWRFAGDDTRFLGDLYQDLSEAVRKRYALLQTPHFVEAFILDHTLEPAIEEYGLEAVRVIDPTCGSGHFLLGAFERLLDHRLRSAPGIEVRAHAQAALGQVYGVDINPYAVAIARFRLTLVYLARCGFTQLAQAPRLSLNLVVADSLLHGAKDATLRLTEQEGAEGDEAAWGEGLFVLDDPVAARKVFGQGYHVVVGNPPYITCKDAKLREKYREAYTSAAGKYALAAPFTERFFQLAVDGAYVGMINANSFMKREFGKALIEKVLPQIDLTRVIDTAGAYIPGHGTPTVLLFGRSRRPANDSVAAVLGKRGEPTTPEDAEQGRVWRSIVDHLEETGFENDYVSMAGLPRATLAQHPWSLGGGGAGELKALLEERAEKRLGDLAEDIGFASFTGLDDAFILPANAAGTLGLEPAVVRPMVVGEDVRDWALSEGDIALVPYDKDSQDPLPLARDAKWGRFLWSYRTVANNVSSFGGKTRAEEGQNWWEWYRWQAERYAAPFRITFAEVATHNHFVLDRGGKVFKQTAPIITLPEDASEDDHLALLAYLNSSVACFWMKQVCYPKSTHSEARPEKGIPEDNRYAFSGTALQPLPVARASSWPALARVAARMEVLASKRELLKPATVVGVWLKEGRDEIEAAVSAGERADQAIECEMVGVQEDLDWLVYDAFGLLDSDEPARLLNLAMPPSARPFLQAEQPLGVPSEAESTWRARQELNRANHGISLLETRVYKRRWWGARGVFASKVATYEQSARRAAADVFLEHLEKHMGALSSPSTVRSLLSSMRSDRVEQLLAFAYPHEELTAAAVTASFREAVPFLSVLCYQPAGLAKHDSWKRTWELQRREDAGEQVGDIPVPPKYTSKDYRSPHYWRLRGKLDVPKERFISYPGCEKDGDPSPLIGWAGWNHLQRAQALIALYQERKLEEGWETERLMPMLVGLHELMFWLELWHSAPEAGSQNPAREFKQFLDSELSGQRLTVDDLEAWKAKKPASTKKAKS